MVKININNVIVNVKWCQLSGLDTIVFVRLVNATSEWNLPASACAEGRSRQAIPSSRDSVLLINYIYTYILSVKIFLGPRKHSIKSSTITTTNVGVRNK